MGNRFFGSKATSGLIQPLIAMMPPHSVYIETHLGGGAVMRRKPPALRNIGIDPNPRVIDRFRRRRDLPVELVEACCHGYLAEYPFDGTELVYSDPPYLHSARKSRRRYRFDYRDADHGALLALLRSLPCAVMLSGYPSAFYDERLPDWRSVSLQVMNQAGVVTEKIWFNFELDRFHWSTCAGRDSTDRQRIKRKAASWGRRYRAMPPLERLAVMASLMGEEAGWGGGLLPGGERPPGRPGGAGGGTREDS